MAMQQAQVEEQEGLGQPKKSCPRQIESLGEASGRKTRRLM
jgi:hypothetical protein